MRGHRELLVGDSDRRLIVAPPQHHKLSWIGHPASLTAMLACPASRIVMNADNAISPNAGRSAFAVRLARILWRLAVDRSYRNLVWLRFVRPKGAFQPFNDTRANRYPVIFSFVRSRLGDGDDIKILSFGCSTGEEVFSLRDYFPHATIKGIDINPANIAACRRRSNKIRDGAISFEIASSTMEEADASFDAIFCMAVLRHGDLGAPGVTRCDHLLRFEDFAKTVADFKRCLKPGGLLIIHHSNFRLSDTPSAGAFETIMRTKHSAVPRTPLFGPDHRLLPNDDYPDTVFRKK